MPTVRLVPREEAQQTRQPKTTGVRRARMAVFDVYVQELLSHPDEAVIFTDIDEDPQKFVFSLRGAFQRAGVAAVVRKMWGRNEVRAWLGESPRRHVPQGSGVTPADDIPEIERVPAAAPAPASTAPARPGRRGRAASPTTTR
jgi:hypothetical protein